MPGRKQHRCGGRKGGSLSFETAAAAAAVTCVRFWRRRLLDPKRYERERFLISLDFRKKLCCSGKTVRALFKRIEPKFAISSIT